MVEILALVLQHDEQAVLAAVELALEAGAPTKTHILNLLHRLVDGNPIDPPAVKPPSALTLAAEPLANVERYDASAQSGGAPCVIIPPLAPLSSGLAQSQMHGMAQAVGELTGQGSPAFEAAVPIRSQLLKAEMADREVRSTPYQLKAARFPNYRDLAGFDFASSEVNEALARQFHGCEFLEDAHNVVLVGGPGTGKTHLATAIGVQAIEHHRKRSCSSLPSNGSTPSSRKSFRESQDRSQPGSPTPISSSSTSLAICRSAPPAEPCSSICSASSMSAPASASSSPPISASASGQPCSATRR
jgi:IstB-like ATP binding protein